MEVCLDPPYKETIKLDLPGPEVEGQYLSEYVAGKMTTELVIRGEEWSVLKYHITTSIYD